MPHVIFCGFVITAVALIVLAVGLIDARDRLRDVESRFEGHAEHVDGLAGRFNTLEYDILVTTTNLSTVASECRIAGDALRRIADSLEANTSC